MEQIAGRALDVPDAVRQKAVAQGTAGRRWLRCLPDLIRDLERQWALAVGAPLDGGSSAYVATAKMADGTDAVLKLQMPGYESVADQIRVLRIAGGRGYVRLLRHDAARGALLQERLGPRLSQLGFSTERQIEIICATLRRAWVQTADAASFPSGADKARALRQFIVETWRALNRPCSEGVVDQAVSFSLERERAFDPARAALLHGDAHSDNTLASFGAETPEASDFKFVDPDGLFGERAYDLAIPMRGWSRALLASDALRSGWERCVYLSQLTGEEPEAIWQWGFIERVSTGLLLLQLGRGREGQDSLRVAEAWVQP